MSDLTIFLEYIDGLDEDKRLHEPGAVVAQALHDAQDELADLKLQTARLIRPINNGKAWVVGFDPDRIGEVAAIGTGIDECNRNIESICNDINDIVAIGDGPDNFGLMGRLQEARRSLRSAQNHAAAMSQKAIGRNPGMPLEKISNLPEVAEAYLDLAEIEATAPAIIAELEGKVAQRREIYSRYGAA